MAELTPAQVLDLPMDENDSGQTTVRGYLVELLKLVWQDGEGFDGKRPFGNSGWDYDLIRALAKAGAVGTTGDPDDADYDYQAGQALIAQAIESLRESLAPSPQQPAGVWIGTDEDSEDRPYATEAEAREAAGKFGRARFYAWGAQLNG